MAKSATYRGFSTLANIRNNGRGFTVADIEAVKTDLLNHIYTIPGERVMLPNFGTRIPMMAFEPNDPTSIQIIKDDLKMVVDYDPRVRLIDIAVVSLPDNNAIVALVDLEYLEFNVTETLRLEFPSGS